MSVIVPARNAAGSLPALLQALEAQTLDLAQRETIVIDEDSRDRTAEVAERGGAIVLSAPSHRGSYAARNQGLEIARGEVLAFTDSDCRPASDWLERGLACLAEREVDLASGRIAMRLRPGPSISEMLSACADLNQGAFAFGGWGATANLFVTRKVVDRIGPFNPELISGGDLEFGLRAREAGFAIWYCDDVVVDHPPRSGIAVPRKAFRTGYGQAQIVRAGSGPAADPSMYATKLRELRPTFRRALWGVERLREAGHDPTAGELRRLNAASFFLGALPRLLGYRAGSLARRSGRRG